MNDLISREAAIAHAISGLTREFEGEKWVRVSEVRERLQAMVSAQSVVKEGHWIDEWCCDILKCSECGEIDSRMYLDDKHCPNCGAKMERRSDDE